MILWWTNVESWKQSYQSSSQRESRGNVHLKPRQQTSFKSSQRNVGNLNQPPSPRRSAPHQPGSDATKAQSVNPNVCASCGKNHGGRPCLMGRAVCFRCEKPGHIARDCPTRTSPYPSTPAQRPQQQGRVFTANAEEAANLNPNQGMCFVDGLDLVILFDLRITHSF